jgi:ribosomal-protein-serine acetyltransferase
MFTYVINEKLELKLLETRHAEELFFITDESRESLRTWLPWVDHIKSKEDSLAFITSSMKQFGENDGFQAGIWFEGRLAGVIGLHKIDWTNHSTSIGYWLAESFTGRGLMTHSCRAVVNYCFEELGMKRVEIRAAAENSKSAAIPERLGFQREGCLRQSERLYEVYVDHYVYGMLKEEWE